MTSSLAFESLEFRRYCAFGLVQSGDFLTVDNGASVAFTINRTNAEMTSIKYNGNELMAPFAVTSRYSHLQSGMGAVTTTTQVTASAVVVACTAGTLTQYYIVRRNYNDIVFGTYASAVPAIGELRWITYLDRNKFTGRNAASDVNGKTTIEGSDVVADSSGKTFSKFYSARPFIDQPYYGVTGTAGGSGVGVWMMTPNRETSSGGPFFQDINEQGSAAIELYNYIFSGHTQTEAFRPGLTLYGLEINGGGNPIPIDFSFVSTLGLQGYVPDAGRGGLSGTVSEGLPGEPVVIGLSNATAQYWTRPARGAYSFTGVKPGTYTQTMYSDQFEVMKQTVTITAGTNASAAVKATYLQPAATWRIGALDGRPEGFLNADKIPTMHPSDVRNASWGPVTYTVGSSPESSFPALQWKLVNQPTKIQFNLDKVVNANHTLRIALSISQYGARPVVAVNPTQTYKWTSAVPAPPTQPDSRGITRGTTRGNNVMFTYLIPSWSLRPGTNTIQIDVASGQTATGYLSPGWAYDSVDFTAPVLASAAVKPTPPRTPAPTIGSPRDGTEPVRTPPPFTPLTPMGSMSLVSLMGLRSTTALFGETPLLLG